MPIILANDLINAICEASGVDPDRCHRVIIDAEAGAAVRVYFDCFGDEQLLELTPPLVKSPRVRRYMTNEKGEHVEVTTA